MFLRTLGLLSATIASGTGCTLWPPVDERAIAKEWQGGCELTVQTRIWGVSAFAGRYPFTGRFYVPAAHGKYQASEIQALYDYGNPYATPPYDKPYKAHLVSGTIAIEDQVVVIDLRDGNGERSLFNGSYPLVNEHGCK
jgi:hypothetical protein